MKENSLLSKVFGIINKAGNAVLLNLLFLVSCLPIVTIGPAWCGLYSAVRYEIRGEKWFDGYKAGFRTRFLRSAVAGVLGCALILYLGNNAYYGVHALMDGAGGWISTGITVVFLVVASMVLSVMLALNVYIPTDVDTWIDNTFFVLKKAPVQVVGVTALMWAPLAMVVWDFAVFMMIVMVFLTLYFTMAAVVMTGLLKNVLIKTLERQRAREGVSDQ